jgi:hypothetical protein
MASAAMAAIAVMSRTVPIISSFFVIRGTPSGVMITEDSCFEMTEFVRKTIFRPEIAGSDVWGRQGAMDPVRG